MTSPAPSLLRRAEPVATTLNELIQVLSDLTHDEDEIVMTMLHMVEGGRVQLIHPAFD